MLCAASPCSVGKGPPGEREDAPLTGLIHSLLTLGITLPGVSAGSILAPQPGFQSAAVAGDAEAEGHVDQRDEDVAFE